MAAAIAPDIEGHLKANDQDALVQLLRPLPEWVLPIVLQQKEGLSVKRSKRRAWLYPALFDDEQRDGTFRKIDSCVQNLQLA